MSDRQSGTTTEQMLKAPDGALYVWGDRHLDYPKALARKLGRTDLMVVSPGWLDGNRWRGIRRQVIIDHYARTVLTGRQWETIRQIWDYHQFLAVRRPVDDQR